MKNTLLLGLYTSFFPSSTFSISVTIVPDDVVCTDTVVDVEEATPDNIDEEEELEDDEEEEEELDEDEDDEEDEIVGTKGVAVADRGLVIPVFVGEKGEGVNEAAVADRDLVGAIDEDVPPSPTVRPKVTEGAVIVPDEVVLVRSVVPVVAVAERGRSLPGRIGMAFHSFLSLFEGSTLG